MSPYEDRRWTRLQQHWAKKAERRERLPPKARETLEKAGSQAKDVALRGGRAVQRATPAVIKDKVELATDAALVPAAKAAAHLLELVTDWSTELTDPETVLEHHRTTGRPVADLQDLKELDLEHLDEFSKPMALQWRTRGALEGASMGALAMVPYAGGVAAISLDMLVMHVMTTSLATRVAYSYGFDVREEEQSHHVDRMVLRAYRNQLPKAQSAHAANAAYQAAKGRIRRSEKLLQDHRLLAAIDKLTKQLNNGKLLRIDKVAKGLPFVAIVAGAGTNAYVLGDVIEQGRMYAQTVHLAEKYGLPLPKNLRLLDDDD